MYIAELHGKLSRDNENKEDILTSNVFSFFKYSDRTVFLQKLLKIFSIDVTPRDSINAEFYFWNSYEDRTEPDLVIIVGEYYLLIEAKYFSGFGEETSKTKHQLVRELEGGISEAQKLNKRFRIIAVTAHYYYPPEIIQDIPPNLQSYFIWVNWQKIAFLISQILGEYPILPSETKLFAEDLYRLLLRKNLRSYEGIPALDFQSQIDEPLGNIFFEANTAKYRGDFIGFMKPFEQDDRITGIPPTIFFAATTADYRGDFIGFHNVLSQLEIQTTSPNTLFYSTNENIDDYFHSLNNINIQGLIFDDIIFFKGGSYE